MPRRQRGRAIPVRTGSSGRALQSFLRRPTKKSISLSERVDPGGHCYPRPNEFSRAGLTPQFVKVLVVVKVKWLKCIKNHSKFIEAVFAVIACWGMFDETPTTAAKGMYRLQYRETYKLPFCLSYLL